MERASFRVPSEPVRHSAIANQQRLAALRSTGLLDSPPEECFDRLTRMAAQAVNAAGAFISLVDAQQDFYKSFFGFLEPLATTRRLSGETFCHFTLLADGVLAISDSRAHPILRRVPTVESLDVIAYLGVPLVSPDGHGLGAFCVIDRRPREWTRDEVSTVLLLARAAMREVAARMPPRAGGEPARQTLESVGRSMHLSPREIEVMKRILAGQHQKQIAADLDLSAKTIATHRFRLLRKLQLQDNHELFRFAVRNGLVNWF